MSSIDYVYVATGMPVILIALFKRGLLIRKKSFQVILGISLALFLAGFVIHFSGIDRHAFAAVRLNSLLSLA